MRKLFMSAIFSFFVVKAIFLDPLLPAFLAAPRHYINMVKSANAAESLAKDFKVITRLFWNL